MRAKPLRLFLSLFTLQAAALFAASGYGPPWGYSGENGPEFWGQLSPEYALASRGVEQSPIDLVNLEAADWLSIMQILYRPTPLSVHHSGHTLLVNCQPGNFLVVGNQRYELLQIQLHSPSEHTVDGGHYGMEIHFLHRNASGQIGFLAAFMAHGKSNDALEKILTYAPPRPGMTANIPGQFLDPNKLLPKKRSYINYRGSLTTPPCTEGVNWMILQQPIDVSAEQIKKFRKMIGKNARPVQPLNQRRVFVGGS